MSLNQPVKPIAIPQTNGNVLMKLSDFLALSKVPLKIVNQSSVHTEKTDQSSKVQHIFHLPQTSGTENAPVEKRSESTNTNKKKKNTKCPECKKRFSCIANVRRHIANVHPYYLNKPTVKGTIFKCDICVRTFTRISSLRKHERIFHNTLYLVHDVHKCPLCPVRLPKKHFSRHFADSHGVYLKTEQLRFKNFEEFQSWKKTFEKETTAYFCKTRQTRVDYANNKYHYFECHRSGTFKHTGKNKRKLKAKGSIKIGAYCPAFITVVESYTKECEVTLQSQHLGHENDVKYLPITSEERQFIASKLTSGLPLNVILDQIKKSENSSARMRILTKKDLYNIKARCLNGKSTDSEKFILGEEMSQKMHDIRLKHSQCKTMKVEATKLENGWMLTCAEDSEKYFIKENQTKCTCQISCVECMSCIHSYSCSCFDSSVDNNMCKHIHFLCSLKNQGKVDDNVDVAEIVIPHESSSGTCDRNVVSEGNLPLSVIPQEKRNDLRQRCMEFIDSVTSLEQFQVLENTLLQLIQKQSNSSDRNSSSKSSESISVSKDLPVPSKNSLSSNFLESSQRQTNSVNLRKSSKTSESIPVAQDLPVLSKNSSSNPSVVKLSLSQTNSVSQGKSSSKSSTSIAQHLHVISKNNLSTSPESVQRHTNSVRPSRLLNPSQSVPIIKDLPVPSKSSLCHPSLESAQRLTNSVSQCKLLSSKPSESLPVAQHLQVISKNNLSTSPESGQRHANSVNPSRLSNPLQSVPIVKYLPIPSKSSLWNPSLESAQRQTNSVSQYKTSSKPSESLPVSQDVMSKSTLKSVQRQTNSVNWCKSSSKPSESKPVAQDLSILSNKSSSNPSVELAQRQTNSVSQRKSPCKPSESLLISQDIHVMSKSNSSVSSPKSVQRQINSVNQCNLSSNPSESIPASRDLPATSKNSLSNPSAESVPVIKNLNILSYSNKSPLVFKVQNSVLPQTPAVCYIINYPKINFPKLK